VIGSRSPFKPLFLLLLLLFKPLFLMLLLLPLILLLVPRLIFQPLLCSLLV
jgi:hypothetical protein